MSSTIQREVGDVAGNVACGCPLCGATGSVRFRLPTYEIHRCHSCGTEFNASFRGGGGDGDLFGREYFKVKHEAAFAAAMRDYRQDPSFPVFERRLAQIERRIDVGSVLDVGPGLGTFLRTAHGRGWDAHGVELSAFAAEFIRTTHGVPVFTGDLTAFEASGAHSFDLITFWDSIEHVGSPLAVLRSARRMLRPGGLLVIATDNFDCLVADIGSVLYRLTGGWFAYPVERVFIDRNRTYFTEASLRLFLSDCGFRVVYTEKMEYPLQKIRTNTLEKAVLASLYGAAHVTGRQAQVTMFAERAC